MKFIVNSQVLIKNLSALSGVVGTNKLLPILNNFLFVLKDKTLTLTASDSETIMVVDVELSETSENGAIAIPAKILMDLLKTFSDLPLVFTINEDDCSVEITAGEGKYKLVGEKADGFVEVPEAGNLTKTQISASILGEAIQKTVFATGNDDLRPVMSGVFFELSPENIRFVATDAHKLVRYTRTDAKSEVEANFIIHKKPLNLLKNVLVGRKDDAPVSVEFNERNAFFTFENTRIICRLIDGRFPNYKAVIPENNPNKLTVDRQLLLNAVRRVSIFSEQSIQQARLKINGKELTVSAEDREFSNEAKERITCSYEGEPIEIGFNTKFLMEMLGNLDTDEVMIEMSHPTRPGLILPVGNATEGEDVLMLVMPIMLNN
jgi:DNA polymerase-3 subunit beta